MKLTILLAMSGLVALAAESGMEVYQRAVTQERAGKMDRTLAAKALFQAAAGYEKLAQDKAAKLYEPVTREYGDQREADTARYRLPIAA